MYKAIYAEVNGLCIIMLMYIIYCLQKSTDKQVRNLAFVKVLLATIAILVFDLLWTMIEGIDSGAALVANKIINAAYLFLAALVSYYWLYYVQSTVNRQKKFSRHVRLLLFLPIAALFVLCVTSIWTGWLFYIDDLNVYHRGALHIIQVIISYTYILFATGYLIIYMIRCKSSYERGSFSLLLMFFVLPSIGGIISYFFYGIPLTWPFAALSLLMVFISYQEHQISTDGLTGVNNRRQFDIHLREEISDNRRDKKLCLLIMDVNSFKHINDTYGHVEGDNALICVADILRTACRKRDAFIARYGGDEFAIIYLCGGIDDALRLKDDINEGCRKRNASSEVGYSVTLSIGVTEYYSTYSGSVNAFISHADELLYKEKQEFKKSLAQNARAETDK